MEMGFFSLFDSTYNINGSLVQGQERAGRDEKKSDQCILHVTGRTEGRMLPKRKNECIPPAHRAGNRFPQLFSSAFKGREEGHAWRFNRDCFVFPPVSFTFLFFLVFLIGRSGIQMGVKRGIKGSQNGLKFLLHRSRKATMANNNLASGTQKYRMPRLEERELEISNS